MNIEKELLKIGLSEKEVATYVALLKLGTAKASQIAKQTDTHRVAMYDVLQSLVKRGIVNRYQKGSVSYFSILEPNRLLTYLDREKEEKVAEIEKQKKNITAILPQLISLQDISSMKPKVKFFEGKKGMREAYEDTLTSRDMIFAYANGETMHEALPHFFPEYYKRRVKKGIFIRAIIPQNEEDRKNVERNREEMRDTRYLPDARTTFTPEINIYNNKILFVSWIEKIAVILESKEVADTLRLTHKLLWDRLPPNAAHMVTSSSDSR